MEKDILNQNIINQLGIEALPEEKKLELLASMADLVQTRVVARMIEQLSEEDQKKVLDVENDPEKMLEFMQSKVPNFMDLVQEETARVKEEMVEATKDIK